MSNIITPTVFYRTLNVEGLEIFYREAGSAAAHDQLHRRFHDLDKLQPMTYSVRTVQTRGNYGRIAF
jgi:hypothetical protein